uniref:Uncharacterized protein n=1 Tax=Globodera rostochiensis TaxID=31243 RepID=A0A914GS83_GLORO
MTSEFRFPKFFAGVGSHPCHILLVRPTERQTNQSEPQANNNPIESLLKIKVEPQEEQFDGRWQDESALKGNVKVEHEPHYGAVKVEGHCPK